MKNKSFIFSSMLFVFVVVALLNMSFVSAAGTTTLNPDGTYTFVEKVDETTSTGFETNLSMNTDPTWVHNFPQWNTAGLTILSAKIKIRAFDVDYPYELDGVHIDGTLLSPGHLLGYSNVWSETSFDIPLSTISDNGLMDLKLDVDMLSGYWITKLDFSEISINYSVSVNTALTVTATPVQYSDKTTFTATLTSQNQPLQGKTIRFLKEGTLVGTALTDASGVATLSPVILNKVGTYKIVAVFKKEPANYLKGSRANTTLVVSHENQTIEYVGSDKVISNEPMKLLAKVTQEDDGFAGDLTLNTVQFDVSVINEDDSLTFVKSHLVACDTNGYAAVVDLFPIGVYQVTASVVPNDYFIAPSTTVLVPVYSTTGKAYGAAKFNGLEEIEFTVEHTQIDPVALRTKGMLPKFAPKGELRVRSYVNDFYFTAQTIDWISMDANSVQFKGVGSIAGQPGVFSYRVNCTDSKSDTVPNKVTIKIWEGSNPDMSSNTYYYVAEYADTHFGDINVKFSETTTVRR